MISGATNFTYDELCRSTTADAKGLSNNPTDEVLANLKTLAQRYLQPLRDHFGCQIIINSAYRAPMVNKAVGGASGSWHLKGCAADIRVSSALVGCQMVDFFHRRFTEQGIPYQELLLSKSGKTGNLWLHIAFNPDPLQSALRCRLMMY
jgi:hypothetical protein